MNKHKSKTDTHPKVETSVVWHDTHDLVLVAKGSDELAHVAASSRGLHELNLVGHTLWGGGNINTLDRDKITAFLAKGWGIVGLFRRRAVGAGGRGEEGVICVTSGGVPFIIVVFRKVEVDSFVDG